MNQDTGSTLKDSIQSLKNKTQSFWIASTETTNYPSLQVGMQTDTLIIGGSDHYTGIDNDIKACYKTLEDKIYKLDKAAKITYKWFTEDCIVIDSLPFVGHYSSGNQDMILITGFAKWGFTNAHVAAKNVTNMLLNKKYDNLYKTNRYTLLKNLKSTGRMIAHSIDGLILSKLFIKKEDIEEIGRAHV